MKKTTSSRNLKSILKKGEDYKTEFKEAVYKTINKEIVAFANASGGKIYIGITDEGEIKGINITNGLKSQIENIAKNCDPKISVSFQEMKKEKVLIVEIEESKKKPHRCSSGYYIRSGATSQKLNSEEIRDFMEEEDLLNFDKVPCKEFDFKKDFDKEKLFAFMDRTEIKYNRRSYIQILGNLKVAKKQGSKIIFNKAGVLFFSKNLDKFFPHAEISCALFKGTDKYHDIIDRKIFNRDIINNIEDSVSFFKKHLRLEYHFPKGQLQRKEILEIPEDALREALVNAVTHRNYITEEASVTVEIYNNRVEIYNFGGLHKKLKKSEFGTKSITRNKLIASLMLRAKYIEKMGTGIKKMRRLVRKAGLKPIKFKFTNFTTLTFYRKPLPGGYIIKSPEVVAMENLIKKLSITLGVTEKKVNSLLQILIYVEEGLFSQSSFSKSFHIPLRTVERNVNLLKKHQLISFEGSPRSRKYKVTKKYEKLMKPIRK